MIRRIDLRGERRPESPEGYRTAVPRADFDVEAAVPAVHAICEAVRTRGLEAVLDYNERFDGVRSDDVRVPEAALADGARAARPGGPRRRSRSRSAGCA